MKSVIITLKPKHTEWTMDNGCFQRRLFLCIKYKDKLDYKL